MDCFGYDKLSPTAEYYEILQGLIERWEYETVEFKEAKSHFDEDKIGRYFSAISNEANLNNQQYGWLVFGVSESNHRCIVGTSFKKGSPDLIEKFKFQIAKNISGRTGFMDIIELEPIVKGQKLRVLMFQIPAAAIGMPTEWKGVCYARAGESLILMSQDKIDRIRRQDRQDWSRKLLTGAGIEHLDKKAIQFARDKFLEKTEGPYMADEVKSWTDEEFLTKTKLMINGGVTNAGMLLLGQEQYDSFFPVAPKLMWRLYGSDGDVKDYKLFSIPFILAPDQIFSKVRNLNYRYMPNQQTLFPVETQQYDSWMLRELLYNCIAHSNYQLGGRIYINEFEDFINITNPGSFLPDSIEQVLQSAYSPPYYRNPCLVDAMVRFHMIETASSGIRRVFRIQKAKCFPMPDYDLSDRNQVSVTVYGKILNKKYTQLLYSNNDELDLETVFLLDQVQKHKTISKKQAAALKKNGFIEGRYPNVFVSLKIADAVGEKADYVHNKGLEEDICKQLIIQTLKAGPATHGELLEILKRGALPGILDEQKKARRVSNLLQKMKREGLIDVTGSRNHAKWHLV